MKKMLDWLDHRVGFRNLMHEMLYERIPGGARWRYVWGSTLVFTFMVQVVTGFFLWTAYSPSAQTAWESVYFIQDVMQWGWLVRGIHHFAAQAMTVLMAFHLIQVVIDGAYRAPREVNFWLGLVLMQIVLGLSLTGYLLPWDQKGYYATQVSTEIMGATPIVGPMLQQLVQGGPRYGHHTLTRFFALHAGLLPALFMGFLVLHIYVFRRHGITVPNVERAPDTTFWPDQVLRDGVACLAVLSVVLVCVLFKGAELSAPADSSEPYSAARPEWYFLSLFRFLKFQWVEHFGLAFGAIYVPGAVMTVFLLMPILGIWKWGHRFNVVFLFLLTAGVVALTGLAIYEDRNDPDYQAAVARAGQSAERAIQLARMPKRIPVEGAVTLLRSDPYTQGPKIFATNCASCHRIDGHDGTGRAVTLQIKLEDAKGVEGATDLGNGMARIPSLHTAADLGKFGSRDWLRSVITDYNGHFAAFKNAADKSLAEHLLGGDMADWSQTNKSVLSNPANKESVDALIEFVVAQSGRKDLDPLNAELVKKGQSIFAVGKLVGGSFSSACADCHVLHPVGAKEPLGTEGTGPLLTGYGGASWLKRFLTDPGSPTAYGEKNHMPAFNPSRLSERELDLLVRWMTGDFETPVHAEAK